MAVVHSVGPVEQIKLKSGETRDKRNFELVDDSGEKGQLINFGVWGQ